MYSGYVITAQYVNIKVELATGTMQYRLNVLLILLLGYTLSALFLKYTFPVPMPEWVEGIMDAGYWITVFATMFLLAIKTVPEAFYGFKSTVERHQRWLLFACVSIVALLLGVSIRTGGDIHSPYVSFLASFPIFFMVLLFDKVSAGTCLKGAAIAVVAVVGVYIIDYFLQSLIGVSMTLSEQKIKTFLGSAPATRLAFSVLGITFLANLASIYYGARKNENLEETTKVVEEVV